MPTKTEAVKAFLIAKTHADLAGLYNLNMECQVNVAQDGGSRIDGDYKGKKWVGWTDGLTTWKPFRIPWKANSEPEYEDSEMRYDLAVHVEAIGMTGWDWKARCSRWVAYDFDHIVGHSDKAKVKLDSVELEKIKQIACGVEWITVRKSTSGKGLHLYVFLPDGTSTANHNEHAALARAILGKLSALTGFDFSSKVDICGGNMWVWHRKMIGTDGLSIVKQGGVLYGIPENWRDHIKVVNGSRRKNQPQQIPEDKMDAFEELMGQRPIVPLDDEHKRFISYLNESGALWWWDQDNHMLITHSIHLKEAHSALKLKGYFDTIATGKERGHDHNLFMCPLRKGAWIVRRYSPGVQEHPSWAQDHAGWTRCFFNREPDLATAARAFGGVEDPKGGFVFSDAESASKAAMLLGTEITYDAYLGTRRAKLKQHKDGRLIVEIDKQTGDTADKMRAWLSQDSKPWTKIYDIRASSPDEPEVGNYDDMARHLVTESNEDYGWMIKADGDWRYEPLTHVKVALTSLGLNPKDVINVLGTAVFKCWRLVNKPFQPEYPGDREWNRNAAQLKFQPTQNAESLSYPTWLKVLEHCGAGLNNAIKENGWCKSNGIVTGADYLKCWTASLFQHPTEPLPYLFFYGPQNSGKTTFHEALSLLLTRGYKRADAALKSQGGFNAELEGTILAIVEETDLQRNLEAYNRIKDWVTSKELLIHPKNKTPYHTQNTTHWIQCNNDYRACPVFPGDSRITMAFVSALDELDMIPKRHLIPLLEKEAPNFLAEILNLELPESNDRLNVPVIVTEDKTSAEQLNQSDLQKFVSEKVKSAPGRMIKFSEFYDRFIEQLDPNEVHKWSKIRVGKELAFGSSPVLKGRNPADAQYNLGNVTWTSVEIDPDEKRPKLRLGGKSNDMLIPEA